MAEISSTGKFDPGLSSVRGLSSLWVLLYHEWVLLPASLALFFEPFDAGWLGVPIFFMLSVFLLLRSLDAGASLRDYFLRRVKRIWPLYFFTVGLVYLVYYRDTVGFLWNITFLADFVPWLGHQYVFWSLQIEEFAYLFFPAIHAMSRSNKVRLAWVMIAVSVVYLLFIMGLTTTIYGSSQMVFLLHLPPLALGAYGVGILAYLGEFPDLGAMALPLAAIAVVGASFLNSYLWDLVLPFFVAPLMVRPPHLFGSPILVFVGEISYSLYLIHVLLIDVFGIWSLPLSFLAATAMELSVRWGQVVRRLRSSIAAWNPVPSTPQV